MKSKALLVIAVIGAFVYACSPKTATTAKTSEVKKIELTPELAEGKSLYENNCGKCHKLFESTKHTKEDWVPTLDRMAKKAKITDEQKASIYNYLVANL